MRKQYNSEIKSHKLVSRVGRFGNRAKLFCRPRTDIAFDDRIEAPT